MNAQLKALFGDQPAELLVVSSDAAISIDDADLKVPEEIKMEAVNLPEIQVCTYAARSWMYCCSKVLVHGSW